jgi:hypothetical protein
MIMLHIIILKYVGIFNDLNSDFMKECQHPDCLDTCSEETNFSMVVLGLAF